MKKLLVAKGNAVAKYAGTAAAPTTENGATNPNDLAEGAIGIYGLNDVDADANNTDKWSLITAATAAAGKTQDGSFAGKYIVIAQGLGDGEFRTTGPIEVAGISRGLSVDYTAPVKQKLSLGYNITLTAGSMDLPATIAAKDPILLKMIRREVGTNEDSYLNFVLNATASESEYSVASRLAALVDSKGKDKKFISGVKVSHNGTGSAFATSATATVVYGSKTVTTSAAHSVGAGDWIDLDGDLYQAAAVDTTEITLDRAYTGPSQTIANADTLDLGATVPTEIGLEIEVYGYNEVYALAAQGIIENSTIAEVVAPSAGVGHAPDVLAIEKEALAYEGEIDSVDINVPRPKTTVDLSKNYNLSFLEWVNTHGGFEGSNPDTKSKSDLIMAFEDEAQTSGFNMAEVQTILGVLYSNFTAVT